MQNIKNASQNIMRQLSAKNASQVCHQTIVPEEPRT
jgi:hypothetical protein